MDFMSGAEWRGQIDHFLDNALFNLPLFAVVAGAAYYFGRVGNASLKAENANLKSHLELVKDKAEIAEKLQAEVKKQFNGLVADLEKNQPNRDLVLRVEALEEVIGKTGAANSAVIQAVLNTSEAPDTASFSVTGSPADLRKN